MDSRFETMGACRKGAITKMRTKCEVYSRVVGYIRPVQQWNDGKQAEFSRRKVFDVNKALEKQ